MEKQFDRWDLSFLYPDFDDAQFKADLASLKDDAQKGIDILKNESLSRRERLEQAVSYSEQVSAKVDRLNNFISIIEPTLVISLSLIVGMILLSVILPLMGIMSGLG